MRSGWPSENRAATSCNVGKSGRGMGCDLFVSRAVICAMHWRIICILRVFLYI